MSSPFTATITTSNELPDIPSASALEVIDGKLLFITDDAPALFQTALNGLELRRIPIQHLPADSPRIPKPLKPDYEAAIATDIDGEQCIVAFGSGSLQPHRDSGIIIPLAHPEKQESFGLKVLYEGIRSSAAIKLADFNIEGAALVANKLLLFNRGSNHAFVMDWEAALQHLRRQAPLPKIAAFPIDLSQSDGRLPRFSGASALDGGRLLFSASEEQTTDWHHDGEVMGSAIGILDVSDLDHIKVVAIASLKNAAGEIVRTKLEGLHLNNAVNDGSAKIFGVVDNDDGTSQLLQIELKNIP